MPSGIFRGWLIVAASFSILTVAYGVQFSYGVFLPHIMADLELNRVAATAPFSLYVLVYTVMGVISGPATDRLGPRAVVLAGAGLLGLGYFLLATARAEWQLFLFLGLVAGLGMSAVFIPLNATVVRWFFRRRGLALAISGTGVNMALIIGPLAAAAVIPWLGWRTGLMTLAVAAAVLIAVCALSLVRDPEARNLVPDGTVPDGQNHESDGGAPASSREISWSLGEATSTNAFWVITGVYVLTWTMLFFPFVHLPLLAAELGYGGARGATLVAAMGAGGIAGRLVFGWLSDLIGRLPCLYLALAVEVAAFVLFFLAASLPGLYLAAALFIAGSSSATTLYPAIIADNFGRRHIGAVTGVSFSIAGAATAIGPLLAAWIREVTGAYDMAFIIGAGLNAAAILLLFCLRPPVKT
jgi:MFS family permease